MPAPALAAGFGDFTGELVFAAFEDFGGAGRTVTVIR